MKTRVLSGKKILIFKEILTIPIHPKNIGHLQIITMNNFDMS